MSERQSTAERAHEEHLREISSSLESTIPQEVVRWAIETSRDRLTVATAFGAEGCCLSTMIAQVRDATLITPDIFNLNIGMALGRANGHRNGLMAQRQCLGIVITPVVSSL